MKFICDRAPLNEGLQMIVGVVDPRHIKPVLQAIKIVASKDEIELLATDLEIGMKYRLSGVEVEEPGEIILPAGRVASIVREIADEKVHFESDGPNCVIRTSSNRFRVLGDSSDEFPGIPSFPDGPSLEMEGVILKEMIRKSAFAAAPEKMRYALNGLLIVAEEGSPKVDVVATDGRRMVWIKRKANKNSPFRCEAIVPTKGALQIERMVKDIEVIQIRVHERNIFARTANAELVAQLVEGQFPNFRAVVPEGLERKVDLSAAGFASSVRRAALVSDNDEAKSVKIALSPGQMVLASSSSRGGESRVEIAVEYSGPETHITLNPDFLEQALKTLGDVGVKLELRDSVTAAVVRDGSDYLYLTMPITE